MSTSAHAHACESNGLPCTTQVEFENADSNVTPLAATSIGEPATSAAAGPDNPSQSSVAQNRAERRQARDGQWYTLTEFLDYYGTDALWHWDRSNRAPYPTASAWQLMVAAEAGHCVLESQIEGAVLAAHLDR